MLKFRWPFYWEPPAMPLTVIEAKLSISGVDLNTKWQEIPKTDPPSLAIGACCFCQQEILCTEDHLSLSEIASRGFYGDILACETCAKQKGLKW